VLRPGGIYVLNLIDHPPLAFARAEAATLTDAFADAVVIAPTARLEGTEGGNFVLAAGEELDSARIQALLDARAAGNVAVPGERFSGAARVLTDDYAPVDQLLEPHPVAG
jgi:hypothetical protein